MKANNNELIYLQVKNKMHVVTKANEINTRKQKPFKNRNVVVMEK